MIETTLMTFLLQAPPSVIAVELVGSWDNFTKAYSLKKDKRTGHDNWRGCHTFTNITCDGEGVVSAGRNGGLKMGGKYWYFYRLDGDIEYHNPAEPSTTSCPFLPGQPVNILEVPMQIDPLGTLDRRSSSGSIESAVFTLDPSTKYCKPKPFAHKVEPASGRVYNRFFESATSGGAPKSITQASDLQSDDLDRKSEVLTIPCSEINERPKTFQSSVKRSILLTIDKMRGSRSAGSNAWQELKAGLRQPSLENITVPSRSPGDPGKLSSTCHVNDKIKYMISASEIRDNTTWNVSKDNFSHNAVLNCLETSEPTDNEISTSFNVHRNTPLDQLSSPYLYFDKCFTEQQSTMLNATDQLMGLNVLPQNMSAEYQPSADKVDAVDIPISRETNQDLKPHRNGFRCHARRQNNSISSSYNTTENFSPGLAPSIVNTDGMSPYHLPQPETPSISEFGDDNFVSEYKLQEDPEPNIEPDKLSLDRLYLGSSASVHDAAYSGFQGYSLPKTEYESALTLRKIPSNPLTADCESSFKNQGSKDLVHSWNDGGQHRISLLNELVDDLGYLGELII